MSFPVEQTLKNRRAAVIGSGPGGLMAAIALAVRGARVVVLEKAPELAPGMKPESLEDFSFEPWPPMLWRPHALAELFASAGVRLTDFVTLKRFTPHCRFQFPEKPLDLVASWEQTVESFQRVDRERAAAAEGLLRRSLAAAERYDKLRRQWPFRRARSRRLPRLLHSSGARTIRRRLGQSPLANAFASSRVLTGVSPWRHGALSLRLLGELQANGGWYVEGGISALRGALIRLCQVLGVRLVTNAHVERLELQSGRVRRLHGDGFKSLTASLVVSNASTRETVRSMLPKTDEMAGWLRQLKSLPTAPGCLTIDIAAAGKLEHIKPLTILPSENPGEEARSLDRWRLPALFPAIAVAHQSSIHAHNSPAGHAALSLRVEMPPPNRRFRWDEDKVELLEEMIFERLDKAGIGGLDSASVFRQARHPMDMTEEAQTGDWGSGITSLIGDKRSLRRLPANRAEEAAGLYFATPSAFPGAGLDNAAIGAMLVGVLAARDAR